MVVGLVVYNIGTDVVLTYRVTGTRSHTERGFKSRPGRLTDSDLIDGHGVDTPSVPFIRKSRRQHPPPETEDGS